LYLDAGPALLPDPERSCWPLGSRPEH